MRGESSDDTPRAHHRESDDLEHPHERQSDKSISRPASVTELVGVCITCLLIFAGIVYRFAIIENSQTEVSRAQTTSDAERKENSKLIWDHINKLPAECDDKIARAITQQTQVISAQLKGYEDLSQEKIANTNRRVDDMVTAAAAAAVQAARATKGN